MKNVSADNLQKTELSYEDVKDEVARIIAESKRERERKWAEHEDVKKQVEASIKSRKVEEEQLEKLVLLGQKDKSMLENLRKENKLCDLLDKNLLWLSAYRSGCNM